MRRAIALICLGAGGLVACAPHPPERFRDPQAPIGATTRFDAQSFSGRWQLVASFEPLPLGTVEVSYAPEAAQFEITSAAAPGIAGRYRQGAVGELIALDPRQDGLIVLWVDEDFETAAIGTVSGRFGAVFDRDGRLPADRSAAVREIFDFYGWDADALKRTAP
ncbi:lipocalin/fatty acid-binding family protein [Roseobacter weihaiensis]|uniref:hypothetical protein n=1 Tax=Roseobacter weihaiensis TaxID=2763262 RepID=UPI001D09BD42|nr:hypothetical protein [Roseobacter sp. H9]